jgi:hypothetical protein
VAGALHPIVGRFGPDTVDLFTFLTLSDFRVSFGNSRRGTTIFIGARSIGLIPLPPAFRFASASRNALSFAIVFAIGFRLSLRTSASVRCDIPIRAASFPSLSELSIPEARPSFASRVKTPYNGWFGGRGNKARLSISFRAE